MAPVDFDRLNRQIRIVDVKTTVEKRLVSKTSATLKAEHLKFEKLVSAKESLAKGLRLSKRPEISPKQKIADAEQKARALKSAHAAAVSSRAKLDELHEKLNRHAAMLSGLTRIRERQRASVNALKHRAQSRKQADESDESAALRAAANRMRPLTVSQANAAPMDKTFGDTSKKEGAAARLDFAVSTDALLKNARSRDEIAGAVIIPNAPEPHSAPAQTSQSAPVEAESLPTTVPDVRGFIEALESWQRAAGGAGVALTYLTESGRRLNIVVERGVNGVVDVTLTPRSIRDRHALRRERQGVEKALRLAGVNVGKVAVRGG